MRLTIRGARLVDPAGGLDTVADLHVADGRIAALGPAPAGFVPERVIEAAGLVACPGLVDLAARLREPGQEHKATIASETRAAAAGGITTLCCPPDTEPVIDTPAVAELIQRHARAAGFARVLPIGAVTQGLAGAQLSEMAALREAGCVAVGDGLEPLGDPLLLRRAMAYAATFDLPLHLRPEDPALRDGGIAHEGRVATRLGLPGIPPSAETVAIARALALAEETGARVHFCRLSTARGVALVRRAKAEGLAVTADVSAHQLHLTEDDLEGFDPQCHLRPPLREGADREALRAGLADGTLDAVCSDHQPHEADAKLAPFGETEPGISALETLLPLTLALVADGVCDLATALARLTAGPAAVLGLAPPRLAPGAVADVCLFDPDAAWTVEAATLRSRGRNSPFLGRTLRGRVRWTLLEGRIVHEEPAP
ncbi:dihydroorotase [Inmirania thermothiophila]|uniref:Dihydroorotase n=1 Tax=Inmirania thermothiophila TaxID=1750597 RepID=A0A3N1Y6T0_9GAMM|nr:dihydroorotase [Inmirania thermothiophila]ROR34513.1 dihydroorotase [Inmirania thermothiophila]